MNWMSSLKISLEKPKILDNKQEQYLEILVVEDDTIVSRLHRFCLEGLVTNEVRTFENGKEAMTYLQESASENKKVLVLLDLNMPVMNGWEFLNFCRAQPCCEQVSVAILTSSSYKEDAERARSYDRVIGYYTKPLNRKKILEILELQEDLAHLVEPAVKKLIIIFNRLEKLFLPHISCSSYLCSRSKQATNHEQQTTTLNRETNTSSLTLS